MKLEQIKRGQSFIITAIPNDNVRAQAIRFGLAEGEMATCEEIIPAGPVVLRKNRQEIVLGRGLAKTIDVELLGGKKNGPLS